MSEKGQFPELNFGDFNLPNRGENMLGKVEFTPKELFSSGKQMEELFWLPIEPEWLDVATQLQVCNPYLDNINYCPQNGQKGCFQYFYIDQGVKVTNLTISSYLLRRQVTK